MNYPDFPIPEQEKSYIPQEDVLDYLKSYAAKFELLKYIRFEHYVVRVRPIRETTWEIIVRDLRLDKYETYEFDAVMVSNGHYHTPMMPNYPGTELFAGKQIHSHDYRQPESFKGNRFA